MSLKQLNVSYVPDEDRVMFRFTTAAQEEYRLWLTRSMMGELWKQLVRHTVSGFQQMATVQNAPAVAQIMQQSLEQAVTYTKFQAAHRLPLGAEPAMVKTCQILEQAGHVQLVLGLKLDKQLTLRLNDDVKGKLQVLFQRMNETARWQLDIPAGHVPSEVLSTKSEQLPIQDAPSKVLH